LAIRRLTEQLDHLVDALRLHERRASITLAPVEIAPLLEALGRENAELAHQSGLTFRVCPARLAVMAIPSCSIASCAILSVTRSNTRGRAAEFYWAADAAGPTCASRSTILA
jgi:hypothetical protein